jgi:hypothetical protein
MMRISLCSSLDYVGLIDSAVKDVRVSTESPSVVSKATAADSDEATNFSFAVASDTTLGLSGTDPLGAVQLL